MKVNSINYYSKEIKQLSAAEKKYYFQLASIGDEYARNKLKEHYTLFVINLVVEKLKIKPIPGLDMDDLISIGILGMFKALNSFKLDRGVNFVSYAKTCIKNEIFMELRKNKRHRTISVNKMVYYNGNALSLLDTLCDDCNIEEAYNEYELYEEIRKALFFLTAKEHQVVSMRNGFEDNEPLSQKEIGVIMNRSQSTVSRIEASALIQIKDYLFKMENHLGYNGKSEVNDKEVCEQKVV